MKLKELKKKGYKKFCKVNGVQVYVLEVKTKMKKYTKKQKLEIKSEFTIFHTVKDLETMLKMAEKELSEWIKFKIELEQKLRILKK